MFMFKVDNKSNQFLLLLLLPKQHFSNAAIVEYQRYFVKISCDSIVRRRKSTNVISWEVNINMFNQNKNTHCTQNMFTALTTNSTNL